MIDAPTPRIAQGNSHRFLALDALRGAAALVVVTLHARNGFAGLPDPRSGYLAVDLFFLLSGFVIASAYDARLGDTRRDGALTWKAFLAVRLVRLYPLYLLGTAIGIAKALLQMIAGTPAPEPLQVALDVLFGIVMLPNPTTIGAASPSLFPLDPPAWSLFYEIAVNVAFALTHRHLTRAVLRIALLALAAVLAAVVLLHGSIDVGNYWTTLLLGLPRAALPFVAGVYLFRYAPHGSAPTGARLAGGLVLVVLMLMLDPGKWRIPYDLAAVLFVFPLLVVAVARVPLSRWAARAAAEAGKVSYAVYVLHGPAIGLLYAILRRLAPGLHDAPLAGPAVLVLSVLACWGIDRIYDAPVRRWLGRLVRRAA